MIVEEKIDDVDVDWDVLMMMMVMMDVLVMVNEWWMIMFGLWIMYVSVNVLSLVYLMEMYEIEVDADGADIVADVKRKFAVKVGVFVYEFCLCWFDNVIGCEYVG